jgi:hypothetical protein
MKISENVPINCKIEFDLKVGFAIYQVQWFVEPYATYSRTGN